MVNSKRERKNKMQKMLLHSCCGPCSSAVLERLVNDFDVTVLYYNPNIQPEEEYIKRKNEQLRLIKEVYPQVKVLDCDYLGEDFISKVKGLEKEKEGGARCKVCFTLRLEFCAQKTKENGFDIFATTLSVSPYKNAKLINEIGLELSQKYGINYLVSDFKKKNGYLRSLELAKKYNLYRQNYCGCIYSFYEAENYRKTKQNKK